MAESIIDRLKAIKGYEAQLAKVNSSLPPANSIIRPVYGDPDSNQAGAVLGYVAYDNSDSGNQSMPVDAKYVTRVETGNDGGTEYRFDRGRYKADNLGKKPEGDKAELLQQALSAGVDLRPLYGTTYADAVQFKQDLGQYTGKDESMIIPANPVGYGGQFQFDPNFGSTFYRDLAVQSGRALGMSDDQILKKGTEYFADKFASGPKTKGIIGFADLGTGLLDAFATTAGVPVERLPELKNTALKPLYDANQKVFSGLNNAARIESQSSGFLKGIGADIAKLGPLGTIALGAALGPAGLGLSTAAAGAAAGALPGLLQGDMSSALKGGAIGGIGGGALKGLGSLQGAISDTLGGGALGNIAGKAAVGSLKGGIGSLLAGGNLGAGLVGGALSGGLSGGINELVGQASNFMSTSGRATAPLGTGITPGAAGVSGLTPPSGFDIAPSVGSNLPDTVGFLSSAPGIGALLDGMQSPASGLNINSIGNQDFGGGVGTGISLPQALTISGQLGQGLTVGVPSGTLSQSGVTPTGRVSIGSPNSFINNGSVASSSGGPDVGKLIQGLLGVGGATALATGVGGLLGAGRQQNPAPSAPASVPTPLNRSLGFQFQAPQYTAGVAGQGVQLPKYEVINPQPPQAPSFLRGFAEGGQIDAINSGVGSIPMVGRFLQGPGDGMSDSIPANIDGEESVMLTDGEYIIPAQAVSALGNGSSKAGAQVLDAMVKRVYKQQTGKPEQMKPINKKVLPA